MHVWANEHLVGDRRRSLSWLTRVDTKERLSSSSRQLQASNIEIPENTLLQVWLSDPSALRRQDPTSKCNVDVYAGGFYLFAILPLAWVRIATYESYRTVVSWRCATEFKAKLKGTAEPPAPTIARASLTENCLEFPHNAPAVCRAGWQWPSPWSLYRVP